MGQIGKKRPVAPGQPDPSYGNAGVVTPDPSTSGFVRALVVDSQERQVFVLWVQGQFWLYRHRKDGTPDVGFGEGGVVKGSFVEGVASRPCDVLVKSNGDILLIGEVMNDPQKGEIAVISFKSDGKPDSEFGTRIIQAIPAQATHSQQPFGCLQPNGNILISAGYSISDGVNPAREFGLLINLLATGELNLQFGGGTGIVPVHFEGKDTTLSRVVALNDGGCVVGGTQSVSHGQQVESHAALARYTASGSLVTAFGHNGYAVVEVLNSGLYDLDVFDEIVYLAGKGDSSRAMVAVYDSAGQPLQSFNDGRPYVDENPFTSWFAIKVQQDRSVVVAGSVLSPRGEQIYARLLQNGQFDQKFAHEGRGHLGRGSFFHLALQPHLKRIVLAGNQVDPVDTPALYGVKM